ncbi:DUF5825 family protein [Solwaraspora sp. WMMD1047]|uniref:DUF5825 family protein n=1 Tax=Solwaraspora sp. WMMD1047 TaxID=3016102 RepID=UPI00241601B8|nr:DUF5825 family protein [Solwaraspora sp. WMMD1047]MDG4830061.1 DUF5825 family protein [Solwaraspora sp. WMMD1047]
MTTLTLPADPTGRLDLAAWSLRPVTLPEPLEFGQSAERDLALLRFLREATSHAVRLRWTLVGQPSFPLDTHVHLVPPSGGGDGPSRAYAARWGVGYRYGSFYYRRGPGLVVVKDVRPGVEPTRLVITDGFDAFLRLAGDPAAPGGGAGPSTGSDPGDAEAAAVAVEAGLACAAGTELLVLPYRMRHWPVPYTAV